MPVQNETVHLSVIVPAYNEVGRIAQTLEAIRTFLDTQAYSWEIIVSADGVDGTREAAKAWGKNESRLTVIGSEKRSGKGKGVRNAVMIARGKWIGFVDADYKTPIDEIVKLLPALDGGYDLAIGSRKAVGSLVQVRQPFYRRAGSKAFALVMHAMVGLSDIQDTQCGFKFFTRAAALRIFSLQRIDGYMFDVEILRLAKLLNYKIKEIGVLWKDDGDRRYAPVSGTIRNAKELLRIRGMKYGI